MKQFNKKISILLSSTLFLVTAANSQNTKDMTFSSSRVVMDSVPDKPATPKYEFGIGGGLVVYQGDLAPTVWGAYRSPMYGFQAHITRLFSPAFSLRLGATAGKFGADDVKSAFKQSYRDYRKFNFTSSFGELSAVAIWTPFAKSNWRLNPYVLGGAGVSYVNVKNNWDKSDFSYFPGENLQQRIADDDKHSHSFPTLVLPVGVGLKYDVSQKVAFRLEWINRITFTDYLDGFSKAANPDKNDRYSSVMLSLNFAFGKNKRSSASRYGSVINNYYYNTYYNSKNSKSESSMASKNGENKQNSSSSEASQDVANTENMAIKDLQAKLDLISQKLDESQQRNSTKDKESDNDAANIAKFDKYIIYFSFDHSYLEGESFNKLDQIAKMMKADPNTNVTLNGYTDLKGTSQYNMKLSSARAATCKDYLKSRGIDANRIKTDAYGKTKYIVGDGSKEQQWVNRRVEVYFN
jgi:OOP family OmpA-OmpF porin